MLLIVVLLIKDSWLSKLLFWEPEVYRPDFLELLDLITCCWPALASIEELSVSLMRLLDCPGIMYCLLLTITLPGTGANCWYCCCIIMYCMYYCCCCCYWLGESILF
jgi:hypothetical protein